MSENQRLLCDYAQKGSESAFRELVARYIDFVYSTARRLVQGDFHRAENITQIVFSDLARMAHKLSADSMLGGWIHRHTCFVAATIRRGERRRKIRETEAVNRMKLTKDEADVLGEAKLALATRDPAPLLRLYDWNGVTGNARQSSTQAAKELVQRKVDSIATQPKGLGGNIGYVEDGSLFSPNGTVVAHLIFKPNDGSAALDLPLGMKGEKLVILGFGSKTAQ